MTHKPKSGGLAQFGCPVVERKKDPRGNGTGRGQLIHCYINDHLLISDIFNDLFVVIVQ